MSVGLIPFQRAWPGVEGGLELLESGPVGVNVTTVPLMLVTCPTVQFDGFPPRFVKVGTCSARRSPTLRLATVLSVTWVKLAVVTVAVFAVRPPPPPVKRILKKASRKLF